MTERINLISFWVKDGKLIVESNQEEINKLSHDNLYLFCEKIQSILVGVGDIRNNSN